MAFKTVQNLKESISGMLSGTDLNNVDNLNGAIERAVRELIQYAGVPEATAKQNLSLFSGVTDYPCDDKIFGTAIIDIMPQGVTRNINDFVYKRPPAYFDRVKGYNYQGTMATFAFENGTPILRVVTANTKQRINIDTMSDTTGWVAAGTASGLTEDNSVYYQQPASLRFTLTGTGSGTLTKTLTSTLDLSAYTGVGSVFLALQIPSGATVADLTNIVLRLGSGPSDYVQITETEGFLGAFIVGEWLLVGFDLGLASTSGSPAWTAIDYVQVAFNHTATFTNMRVGGLWTALPYPVQALFQTAAIFKAGTAAQSTTITNNDDSVILSDPAYTLLEYEGAMSVMLQAGSSDESAVYRTFFNRLHGTGNNPSAVGLYPRYRGDNPDEQLRTAGTWYEI